MNRISHRSACFRLVLAVLACWSVVCPAGVDGKPPAAAGDAPHKTLKPVAAAIPSNDSFAQAIALSGSRILNASSSNAEATREVNEPASTGNRTLWWKWTAPAAANGATKITVGGNVNTHLSVFQKKSEGTTANISALTLVGDAYGYGASDYSYDGEFRFQPVAGREYYLCIGGTGSVAGNVHLQLVVAAVNDNFAAATNVSTSGTQNLLTDNFAATVESGEASAYPYGAASLWWKLQPTADSLETVDTAGSAVDTTLEIFTGSSLATLTRLRQSDNATDDRSARVAIPMTANTVYYVRAASRRDYDEGNLKLSFRNSPAPTTAADRVVWARAYLEDFGDKLDQVDAQLTQALSLSPNDAQANLLQVFTKLALIRRAPAYSQLMTQMGTTDASTGPKSFKFSLVRDDRSIPIPAANANTTQILNYIQQQIVPVLPDMEARLARITDLSFQTMLSDSETGYRFVRIDYGDVQMLRAGLSGIKAATCFSDTYDLALSLSSLSSQARNRTLDARTAKQAYNNLFKFKGNDRRQEMASTYALINQRYQQGSAFARFQRTNPEDHRHLFSLTNGRSSETNLRTNAQNAADSLNGEILWDGKERVNLSKLITTATSLHDMLGNFFGNRVIAYTTPDPTFAGALPTYTQERLDDVLRPRGLLFDISTYFRWCAEFLPGTPASAQAPDANPAGDGVNNVLKFAFGLDPNRPASPSEYFLNNFVRDPVDQKEHLTIRFVRRIGAPEVSYVVVVSSDLRTWDRTQAQVEQVGTPVPDDDGYTETVTFRVKKDRSITPRQFLRVEVQVPTS